MIGILSVKPWVVMILHSLLVNIFSISLINVLGIFSLFIAKLIASLDTESNTALMSNEKIHSSF